MESCIHYLVFNNDDVLEHQAYLKLNPPIRLEEERQALWDSLLKGDIDFISTDHVAWPEARKSDPRFFANASGIPGLETLLPALYTASAERGVLDPTMIARVTAENPARHFGLFPQKGQIAPGSHADVAVFQRKKVTFSAATLTSKVKWTPFDGVEMEGFVSATYLRGRKIYQDGLVLAESGTGNFVRPNAAMGDTEAVEADSVTA